MSGSTNLASGAREDDPGPDLWAYNPVGPTATYERLYRSTNAANGYGSPGLSVGWTDNYDLFVTANPAGYQLTYDNGATESWMGLTGSPATPAGAPYLVNVSSDLSTLTMTFKDRSRYTFTQFSLSGGNYLANTYLLTKITNLVGHAITLTGMPPTTATASSASPTTPLCPRRCLLSLTTRTGTCPR